MKTSLVAIVMALAWAPGSTADAMGPLPKDLSPERVKALSFEAEQLMALTECVFLVAAFTTESTDRTEVGFCLYPHTERQGIYAHKACFGVLVEPQSQAKNPFYGGSGHWGIEDPDCSAEAVLKKFRSVTDEVNNPLRAFRMKREEGVRLRLLRDDLGVWDEFYRLTSPRKKGAARRADQSD